MKQSYFIAAFLLACVLALLHFKFGLQILNIFHGNWAVIPCSDSALGVLSWEYFREQPWTYPIGAIEGYNAPLTMNISLTDGIPIMAVLFKLLHPLFGGNAYYYFGWWFFINCLLQVFFAYKLLSIFLPKHQWLLAFGAIFFLLSPPFLYRFVHHALVAHWTILASFWLYLHPDFSTQKKLFSQIFITALMAWTHPYLAAMMLGMSATLLLKLSWIERQVKWWQAPLIFIGVCAMTLGLWEVMGYFSIGNTQLTNTDFGLYSANSNSLFNSMNKTTLLSGLPTAKSGQYEGFAYLGIGVLILLAIILLSKLFRTSYFAIPKIKKEYLPILFCILLATLFSFSNVWTFGATTFAKMDYPSLLSSRFRSSGRFIWFLHYFSLLVILIVFLKSRIHSTVKWIILIFAISIQTFDNQPFIKREYITHEGNNYYYEEKSWHALIEGAEMIWTYPPHQENHLTDCDYGKLVNIAQSHQKPISTGRAAYYNWQEIAVSTTYLETQLDNNIPNEKDAIFITTFEHYERFLPLLNANELHALIVEKYLVFVPVGIYNRQPKIREMPLVNDELKKMLPIDLQDFIDSHNDAILLISVKDDAQQSLDYDFKQWMSEKGSKINDLSFRGSYAAIIRNGKFVEEQLSDSTAVSVYFNRLEATSAGKNGGNFSSLKINGKEYSPNLRGINIAVVQKDTLRSVINFDTYRSFNLNRAYQKFD